jgi:antitoxin component of MazEF toxin-antitoxin module
MGYQTKVQVIKRASSVQWYINLPAQLAQALQFEQSEIVEWFVEDNATLALRRLNPPEPILKKKQRK